MVPIVEESGMAAAVTQCSNSSGLTAHSSSDRHIHFHMHMHASPSSCSPASTSQQQHHQQNVQQLSLPAASSAQPYPAFVHTSSSRQKHGASTADAAAVQSLCSLACPASTMQQQQSFSASKGAGAAATLQQQQLGSSKRQGRGRVRRVLRALLLSGGATAMVLAGAGGALVLLSPRVEQLEARCSQVGGPCRGGCGDTAAACRKLLLFAC